MRARVAPGDTLAALPEAAPEAGEPMERILADFRAADPPTPWTHWQHPRFFAYSRRTRPPPPSSPEQLAAAMAGAVHAVADLPGRHRARDPHRRLAAPRGRAARGLSRHVPGHRLVGHARRGPRHARARQRRSRQRRGPRGPAPGARLRLHAHAQLDRQGDVDRGARAGQPRQDPDRPRARCSRWTSTRCARPSPPTARRGTRRRESSCASAAPPRAPPTGCGGGASWRAPRGSTPRRRRLGGLGDDLPRVPGAVGRRGARRQRGAETRTSGSAPAWSARRTS